MKILKATIYTLLFALPFLTSCSNKSSVGAESGSDSLTEKQTSLINEGWAIPQNKPSGELPRTYGVTPRYGQQDNYFDIRIGSGCDVAIKIMDIQNNSCIRYCIVPENTTITINQIPQGKYYLKLAYGKDWMEQDQPDGTILGKFTKNTIYEKSVDVFDFGKKNSQSFVNYTLEINVINSSLEQNFTTTEISESEFERN